MLFFLPKREGVNNNMGWRQLKNMFLSMVLGVAVGYSWTHSSGNAPQSIVGFIAGATTFVMTILFDIIEIVSKECDDLKAAVKSLGNQLDELKKLV